MRSVVGVSREPSLDRLPAIRRKQAVHIGVELVRGYR
jgi:hypothetical protein